MDEKRIIQDIAEIASNIRQKYQALKLGIRESDELLTKTYKPLLEPLNKHSETLVEKLFTLKTAPTEEEEELLVDKESRSSITKTPPLHPTESRSDETNTPRAQRKPRYLRIDVLAEMPPATSTPNVTIQDILTSPEGRHLAKEYVEELVKGPLARKY